MAFWRPERRRGRRRGAFLLAASERLYGALLVLYPKRFRHRYASEMRRDFRDLSREGLEEGGMPELARVWAATLSDLAVTALQERGAMLVRDARLPLAPRVAAKMAVAIVLIAVSVTVASSAKTPQYEGSTKLLIGQAAVLPTLPPRQVQELQEITQTMAEAMESRTMAEAAIERLGLSTTPQAFLKRLNVEPIEDTQFIEVSYTDPNPRRAQLVVNTVGEVFSKKVSEVNQGANSITAVVWEPATVPEAPVSPTPLRNGLVVLVLGLTLIAGLALPTWSGATSGVGHNARRMTGSVGRNATSGARGTPTRMTVAEAAKEKELLEALRRRGQLTVAGVALETSLSVEEADRMLSALAAKGHLQVRVEHGRLLYSLWEHDASQ